MFAWNLWVSLGVLQQYIIILFFFPLLDFLSFFGMSYHLFFSYRLPTLTTAVVVYVVQLCSSIVSVLERKGLSYFSYITLITLCKCNTPQTPAKLVKMSWNWTLLSWSPQLYPHPTLKKGPNCESKSFFYSIFPIMKYKIKLKWQAWPKGENDVHCCLLTWELLIGALKSESWLRLPFTV